LLFFPQVWFLADSIVARDQDLAETYVIVIWYDFSQCKSDKQIRAISKRSCLKLERVLSGLLAASGVSLAMGDALLFFFNLVPFYLIALTAAAAVILFFLSLFVDRGNTIALNISTILGVIAPIFSLSMPAHDAVLLAFGSSPLITSLAALQFFGFFIFPVAFVLLRILYWKRLR
jgi:hypothetical protein